MNVHVRHIIKLLSNVHNIHIHIGGATYTKVEQLTHWRSNIHIGGATYTLEEQQKH